MSLDLPQSWGKVRFMDINRLEPSSLNPMDYPNETFELYSVPSFPSGKPEILCGSDIGSTKQAVMQNDVLVCKINPRINRVWTVGPSSGLRQIASSEWIVLRPVEVSSTYLKYFFSSPSFREKICEEVTGVGGSLTRAQPKRVATLEVPIAPLVEQKRIADKLGKLLARVDACRERLDRVPLILKRFRQSVLTAATTGQLTEDWRDDWPTEGGMSAKLSDFGVVSGGVTKNARRINLPLQTKYVTVANVYENELRLGEVGTIGVTEAEFSRALLLTDDLLFVEGNGSIDQIGRVALWDGSIAPCVHQNHIIKFRASPGLNPSYVLFWMMSPRGRDNLKEAAVSTAGLYNLSISKIGDISIVVPTPAEQKEIVRRVETLFAFADRLEARLDAARHRAERLTPATLAKAFRGELVPQDPNDEPASVLLERIRAEGDINNIRASAKLTLPKFRVRGKATQTTEVAMLELSQIQPDHLSTFLKENGRLTPKSLYQMSQLQIDDFYEQLRSEEADGLLREVREGNESYLEAT